MLDRRSPRFVDLAPAKSTPYSMRRLSCSVSTMYRILHANSEVCAHAASSFAILPTPNRVATNEVWSWDITKLKERASKMDLLLPIRHHRHLCFCAWSAGALPMLKVLPYSGFVRRHHCQASGDTRPTHPLHASRGGPMKAKATAFLLMTGVTKSHERTHPTTTHSRKVTSRL